MYQKSKTLSMSNTVGMLAKNLQVVSFDGDWKEIYLGTVRKNHFTAFCPNEVSSAVDIDFKWMHEDEGKLVKDGVLKLLEKLVLSMSFTKCNFLRGHPERISNFWVGE